MRTVISRGRHKTRDKAKTAHVGTRVHWWEWLGWGAGCHFPASRLGSRLRCAERGGVGWSTARCQLGALIPEQDCWAGRHWNVAENKGATGSSTVNNAWRVVYSGLRIKVKAKTVHRTGNAVSNVVITLHGDDGDHTDCGDPTLRYIHVDSLCYASDTNVILCAKHTWTQFLES